MADTYLTNVTGLLDVEAMVKNLTLAKQKQLKKITQEKALLQAKAASINNLLTAIKDLKSYNENLNIDALFKGKEANISDTSTLTAQVSEKAPNVTLRVKVLNLAQQEIRTTSQGVNSLNANLSPSNFTLRYWTSPLSFTETQINFSGGTLNDLVNTINSKQDKVIASVYYDGQSYKLMLTEKNTGASTKETDTNSYVIEISLGSLPTELGSLDVTLQNAQNARLRLGSETGPEITSPTNTFKDIVSGLTITALKTSNNFIDITIKDSYNKVNKGISDLLSKINGVLDLVKQLTAKGTFFQGNATINQIRTSLFNLTKPFQDLGLINIDSEGKYSLNTQAFNNLIDAGKIEELKEALKKTHLNLKNYLEGLSKSFQAYKNTQDKQIQALDRKTEALQRSLLKEEEKLRLTFSKIEALLAKNEQLKARLENFVVSLSEAIKK